MSVLEVRDLAVRFGAVTAVKGVSFTAQPGRVVTVLGRNGAGKSSLLRAIAGLAPVAHGRLLWEGRDLAHLPVDERVRRGIALIPEGRHIFPNLSVWENLRLGGFGLDGPAFRQAEERAYHLFPVLAERARSPASSLSGGMQQMLAIARALMSGPRLILLDEPSLGLAPLVIDDMYRQLARLRERGLGLILVEQQVQRALKFADTALVLDQGEVVLQGEPAALLHDERLMQAYLGKARP